MVPEETYLYTSNHRTRGVDYFRKLVRREEKSAAKENRRKLVNDRRRRKDLVNRTEANVKAYRKKVTKALQLFKKLDEGMKGLDDETVESEISSEYKSGIVSEESEWSGSYESEETSSVMDEVERLKLMKFKTVEVHAVDVMNAFNVVGECTMIQFLQYFTQRHLQ